MVQPAASTPAVQVGQPEPAPTPWQWPDPSPQQPPPLKTNLTSGETATDCFAMDLATCCVECGARLLRSGHACEGLMVTNVNNVSAAATRAAQPATRLTSRNALQASLRNRPDFGVDKANIPRPSSFLGYNTPRNSSYSIVVAAAVS